MGLKLTCLASQLHVVSSLNPSSLWIWTLFPVKVTPENLVCCLVEEDTKMPSSKILWCRLEIKVVNFGIWASGRRGTVSGPGMCRTSQCPTKWVRITLFRVTNLSSVALNMMKRAPWSKKTGKILGVDTNEHIKCENITSGVSSYHEGSFCRLYIFH